jgi:hypothetical protein
MRQSTGPVRLGDDWMGLFIRGDEAIGLAIEIEMAQSAKMLPDEGPGSRLLKKVVHLLKSCEESYG